MHCLEKKLWNISVLKHQNSRNTACPTKLLHRIQLFYKCYILSIFISSSLRSDLTHLKCWCTLEQNGITRVIVTRSCISSAAFLPQTPRDGDNRSSFVQALQICEQLPTRAVIHRVQSICQQLRWTETERWTEEKEEHQVKEAEASQRAANH